VYEYNFPAGKFVSLPHTFVIKTWISNLILPMDQIMNFQVNSQILRIPVPGASFIIGSYNYSYLWQGNVYTNGPYPSDANPGGLSPQFGLVGVPSGGIGYFEPSTSGYMKPYILPIGLKNYISPITYTFTTSNDQTGESATNLNWVNNNGVWYLSILNNSNIQGVISVEPYGYSYNITFVENGLPSGTNWSVTLNGTTLSSTSNTITFNEPNGTYSYYIGSVSGYTVSPSSGSITVNGANVHQAITFTPVKVISKYKVTFTESGLPSGTSWSVTFNRATESSTTDTITFSVPNGTYSYTIGSVSGYTVSPSSGSITVNGASVSESITFSEITYTITFTETGLPSGNWYVNITGQAPSGPISSSTTTYSVSLPNGSYSYTISTGNKEYKPSYTGSFAVNGASVSESITFSEVTYTITFTETGLPSGILWYVTLNGITHNSTTNSIIFTVLNGSYSYTIENPISGGSSIQYIITESFGNITISGTNTNKNINYTTQYYLTMETEHAPLNTISPASGWYNKSSTVKIFLNPDNFTHLSSSGWIYFTFLSWNGSGNGSYTGNNDSANITMNGPITEIANFVRFYVVTFEETGLPFGTEWFVNLSNGVSLIPPSFNNPTNSTSGYYSEFGYMIINGTYSYSVSTVNRAYYSPDHGTFVINGSNIQIKITFLPVNYSISFTETGLPSGTLWSVTLNGATESFTTNTLTFSDPNGTYTYTIQSLAGYRASTYKGTIIVNGNAVSNTVVWSIITYPVSITQSGISSGTSWSATLSGTTFNGQFINVTLSSTTNTITFNEPNGTYTYTVHLPSGYTSSNAKGSTTVSGASTTAAITAQQPTNYLLYIIIVIVVIIAVLGVVMAMRRGKNKAGKT
jgi:hypothetical protein